MTTQATPERYALTLDGVAIENRDALMQTLRRTRAAQARVSAGRKCRKTPPHWLAEQGFKSVSFAVTGSFSTAMVGELLTAGCLEKGLAPTLTLSDYNQFVQDVLDPDSDFLRADADYSLCLLDEYIVTDRLPVPWGLDDIEKALDEVLTLCRQASQQLLTLTKGCAVFNTLPLPVVLQRQILGARERNQLSRLWQGFNLSLLSLSDDSHRVVVLDTQCLMTGAGNWRDDRMAFYAKIPFSDGLMDAMMREVSALAASVAGKGKKALVLDLDNTLWRGILGDDGIDGIGLEGCPTGEAHLQLQKLIKQFASQGVLLNISSKNDADNVEKALKTRHDMALKAGDFLHIHANWAPKSQSVQGIAEALNIGVDSLVFVDDSSFECEEVQQAHPSVATLQVSGEPAGFADRLADLNDFLVMSVSAEDRGRVEKYRQEADRQALKATSADLGSFLQSLNIELRVLAASAADVPRVANLSQRTNQFNMTTQRLSEEAVSRYRAQTDKAVFTLRSQDRFGDYGLIGAAFLTMTEESLHIDNMLLSCRVFSRGIEQAAISLILRWAAETGKQTVTAEFIPTQKNQRMAGFFPSMGFEEITPDALPPGTAAVGDPQSRLYCHSLSEIAPLPTHLHTIYEESCNG